MLFFLGLDVAHNCINALYLGMKLINRKEACDKMEAPKHIHEVKQSSSSNTAQSNQQNQQSTTTAPSKSKTVAQVRDNNDMPITGQMSVLPAIGLVQLIIVTSMILSFVWHKHHARKQVEN